MVYIDHLGKVDPLYLHDIQDPKTGKIPPRLVSLESDRVQAIIENIMQYITPADYSEASKYIPNPEEYDFRTILNW